MEIRVESIKHKDILDIKSLIENSKAILVDNPIREVMSHIEKGIALKLVVDDKLAGIACSIEYEKHTSLSYFYVDPSVRNTWAVLDLFMSISNKVNKDKPVYIETANTDGFSRYVTHVEGNLYKFRGLR